MREWGGRGGAPVAPGHCLNGGSRVEASGQSVVMGRHISYLAEALKAYIINLRVSSDKLHKSVSFIHSFIHSLIFYHFILRRVVRGRRSG